MLGAAVVDELLMSTTDQVHALSHMRPLRIHNPRVTAHRFDLAQTQDVHRVLSKLDIDCVIHCAALTKLETCEADFELAVRVNAIGTREIIKAALARNQAVKFVYISTDAVYPDGPEPKPESLAPHPASAYGISKLWGEEAALFSSTDALVFRTTIIGPDENQFLGWILQTALAKKELSLFQDVVFSPISVRLAAKLIRESLDKNLAGIFNLGSGDSCTKAQFADLVLAQLGLSCPRRYVSLGSLSTRVERSHNMALNCSRLAARLGAVPSIAETVNDALNQLEKA